MLNGIHKSDGSSGFHFTDSTGEREQRGRETDIRHNGFYLYCVKTSQKLTISFFTSLFWDLRVRMFILLLSKITLLLKPPSAEFEAAASVMSICRHPAAP